MEATLATKAKSPRVGLGLPGVGLGRGVVVLYLGLMVLLPLAALTSKAFDGGLGHFWQQVTSAPALRTLELTLEASLAVVLINAVFGTVIAWLLVRDEFPGKAAVNAIIDLPFALPTIVTSLILLQLYGDESPLGVHLAATKAAVVVALLFVTLPFVVRAVQPLLIELDREMEEAAASLGASGATVFRRIVFPNLLPGLAAGVALAFARALGEYGSVLLFAGGLPTTMVSSIFIRQQIESGNEVGAAAVSVVLLAASLALLALVTLIQRWSSRHERALGAGAGGGGVTVLPAGEAEPAPAQEEEEEEEEEERG